MKLRLLFACSLLASVALAQKEVSITLDDVPNVGLYKKDNNRSLLLENITRLQLPVAIFSNEGNLYQNTSAADNYKALAQWIGNKNITAGNHTFNHVGYSNVGAKVFEESVEKGEVITENLLKQQGKTLRYFRFPFNDMGKDSSMHRQMKTFLQNKGYIVAPFTIENSDWAYSAVYEDALLHGDQAKAKTIGSTYVSTTLALFDYFEALCLKQLGRPIKHIYLCHDNALNTDYLPALVEGLQKKGYAFITLDKALTDDVYARKEYYTGSAGFSWLYRWEPDAEKRKALLRSEPENAALMKAYETLQKKN
ncbi:polysaccharide deacetylase family protein [Chryseolinea lacunae]|uniref:Polysaccharide deacetylase family protein n=1 Tax=Chryseolinea lacunae TaxID=2801331 RepID=A0ABS1KYD7_9BACT|nr:polysaccharide deacetylase family protein [Chryseolinea lacunae]MBL0744461.1 polysaccharide deacetylase family protein [Chryseolinea lacunae]